MKAPKHDPKAIRGFEYEPIPGFIVPPTCRYGINALKENQTP